MGFLDSVKNKANEYGFGRTPPPLEGAIENISREIMHDVMAGNYQEAQQILEKNLRELKNGEFEADKRPHTASDNRTDRWETPEKEAHQLTNMVFLELIELVVDDLATIENELEPPIKVNYGGTKQADIEDGLEGEFNRLENFFKQSKQKNLDQYRGDNISMRKHEEFKRHRKGGRKVAKKIRVALGTYTTNGAEDAVNDEKYRESRPSAEGRYKENMGVLITVKMAERHLEFIQHLAEWENEKFGLDMEPEEKREIKEVKNWLEERYEIVKELDQIVRPFQNDKGMDVDKDELYLDPEKSLKRLSKAEEVLDQLHRIEDREDDKIKQLRNTLP